MRHLLASALALLVCVLSVSDVEAHARTTTRRYTAVDKLLRGLAGMTTGFLELPGNIVAVGREENAGAAATIGFAKGLGMIPVRELVGVYEFVSAPIPYPEDYRPVVRPEYPWEYFEDGTHSATFGAD